MPKFQLFKPRGKLQPGTQIIYMPTMETGFVTSQQKSHAYASPCIAYFCRFFRGNSSELRTTSSSELCNEKDLYVAVTREQKIIDDLMEKIGYK